MESIGTIANTRTRKRTPTSLIAKRRWTAYAAAGVASTAALALSAEAEVHYSGPVKYDFGAHDGQGSFALDPGVVLAFQVGIPSNSDEAFGHVFIGGANGAFAGRLGTYTAPSAYSLASRVNLPAQRFPVSCRFNSSTGGQHCYYSGANLGSGPNFRMRGETFIGFEFTNETGRHYGWARVRLSGAPKYRFELVDYAWADAGERLKTGQKTSHSQAAATGKSGALGLLAAGGAGVIAWRAEK